MVFQKKILQQNTTFIKLSTRYATLAEIVGKARGEKVSVKH